MHDLSTHTHEHFHEHITAFESLDQAVALITYMLEHNKSHAEELHEICHKLEASGQNEAAFQRQKGQLPYAINVNGNYITYDWAQPASIPMLLGSAIYDATAESDANLDSIIKQGASSAINSWLSLSPLQSLSDLLAAGKGDAAENIAKVVTQDFPSSFVPTQLGAIAKIADPTQRSTYSKGSGYVDQMKNTISAKVPIRKKL